MVSTDSSKHIISTRQNTTERNSDIREETLFDAGMTNRFAMNIAHDNAGAIMQELSDLSSNRGAYAIREVLSNAYDATKATGDMSRPIEIDIKTLSGNAISGTHRPIADRIIDARTGSYYASVKVTDHGCGMSRDDVEYFFQYGGSNKSGRDTIGSKGLGAKAPLSVSPTFVVTTSHDGHRIKVVITRGESEDYGEIVSDEPCDADDTGTTIEFTIPDVSTYNDMARCINGMISYNVDANIVLNDVSTDDGSLMKNGTYTCLGDVELGVDEGGNPVSVRIWEHSMAFPYKLGNGFIMCGRRRVRQSVAYDLCGYLYDIITEKNDYGYGSLVNKVMREEMPQFIVEGRSGLLNFTISRDEIKRDAAYETLHDRLLDVLAGRDDIDVTEQVVATMPRTGLTDTLSWLMGDMHAYALLHNGDGTYRLLSHGDDVGWNGNIVTNPLLLSCRIPHDMLVFKDDDGNDVDCTGLLCATGVTSDPSELPQRYAVAERNGTSYSVIVGGDEKDVLSVSVASGKKTSCKKVNAIGTCDDMLSGRAKMATMLNIMTYSSASSVSPYHYNHHNPDGHALVMLSPCDASKPVLDATASIERYVASSKDRQSLISMTVAMRTGTCPLTRTERYVLSQLDGRTCYVVESDPEAIVTEAKAFDRKSRRHKDYVFAAPQKLDVIDLNACKPWFEPFVRLGRAGIPSDDETLLTNAVTIVASKSKLDGSDARPTRTVEIDLEKDAGKYAFAFLSGDPDDRFGKRDIVALIGVLVGAGKLDEELARRCVIMPYASSAAVNRIVELGGTVVFDARKRVKGHAPSICDECRISVTERALGVPYICVPPSMMSLTDEMMMAVDMATSTDARNAVWGIDSETIDDDSVSVVLDCLNRIIDVPHVKDALLLTHEHILVSPLHGMYVGDAAEMARKVSAIIRAVRDCAVGGGASDVLRLAHADWFVDTSRPLEVSQGQKELSAVRAKLADAVVGVITRQAIANIERDAEKRSDNPDDITRYSIV